jgi:hypothetical protein
LHDGTKYTSISSNFSLNTFFKNHLLYVQRIFSMKGIFLFSIHMLKNKSSPLKIIKYILSQLCKKNFLKILHPGYEFIYVSLCCIYNIRPLADSFTPLCTLSQRMRNKKHGQINKLAVFGLKKGNSYPQLFYFV